MLPGDSIQFLISGKAMSMYMFSMDDVRKNGVSGHDLVSLGTPLIAVPEPSTLAMLLTVALGGLLWLRRRA
jgi:hypothetical protein